MSDRPRPLPTMEETRKNICAIHAWLGGSPDNLGNLPTPSPSLKGETLDDKMREAFTRYIKYQATRMGMSSPHTISEGDIGFFKANLYKTRSLEQVMLIFCSYCGLKDPADHFDALYALTTPNYAA